MSNAFTKRFLWCICGHWLCLTFCVKSFLSILKVFNILLIDLQRTIDYLKMDIEFSEWPVLYDLIETRTIDRVRQLALEIHTPEVDIHDRPEHLCTWSTVDTMAFMMRTLLNLKKSGFQLFYTRTNHRTKFISPITRIERYCCHNLHFVNVKHEGNRYKAFWMRNMALV